MITTQQLRNLVHAFADVTGNPATRVSVWCWGSTNVIQRLDAGGYVSVDRAVHALQWFSDRWPADKPWPLGLERPPSHPPANWPPKIGRPRKHPLSAGVP